MPDKRRRRKWTRRDLINYLKHQDMSTYIATRIVNEVCEDGVRQRAVRYDELSKCPDVPESKRNLYKQISIELGYREEHETRT